MTIISVRPWDSPTAVPVGELGAHGRTRGYGREYGSSGTGFRRRPPALLRRAGRDHAAARGGPAHAAGGAVRGLLCHRQRPPKRTPDAPGQRRGVWRPRAPHLPRVRLLRARPGRATADGPTPPAGRP